jgi:hypothetical protein
MALAATPLPRNETPSNLPKPINAGDFNNLQTSFVSITSETPYQCKRGGDWIHLVAGESQFIPFE